MVMLLSDCIVQMYEQLLYILMVQIGPVQKLDSVVIVGCRHTDYWQ